MRCLSCERLYCGRIGHKVIVSLPKGLFSWYVRLGIPFSMRCWSTTCTYRDFKYLESFNQTSWVGESRTWQADYLLCLNERVLSPFIELLGHKFLHEAAYVSACTDISSNNGSCECLAGVTARRCGYVPQFPLVEHFIEGIKFNHILWSISLWLSSSGRRCDDSFLNFETLDTRARVSSDSGWVGGMRWMQTNSSPSRIGK